MPTLPLLLPHFFWGGGLRGICHFCLYTERQSTSARTTVGFYTERWRAAKQKSNNRDREEEGKKRSGGGQLTSSIALKTDRRVMYCQVCVCVCVCHRAIITTASRASLHTFFCSCTVTFNINLTQRTFR